MKKTPKAAPRPEMRPEYDFRGGMRGKYATRFRASARQAGPPALTESYWQALRDLFTRDVTPEGLRRLLVNASFWALGMEASIPEKANVAIVGAYTPSKFSFGGYKKGLKPGDYAK